MPGSIFKPASTSTWILAFARMTLRGNARGALPLVLLKETLPDADRLRRDLNELVVRDQLDRRLERDVDRGRETHGFVGAGRADVGELLALYRVDDEVV